MAQGSGPPPSSPSSPVTRAATLAGAATLTSRILGLVREQVLAALFGAGNEMDAFLVAFRIPNLLRDLFAEGAMSAAFVPRFTRHLTMHGRADAWRLGNNVVNALVVITGTLVAVGYVFSRPLVTAYATSFADVPGKLELTLLLARVMLPFLTLAAIGAAVMGMLNSLRHYFVPALAPATFNVVAILFALLLTPVMPAVGLPPIMSVTLAVVLGGATQIAVQWPSLRREGFRYRAVLDPRDPDLRKVLLLMGPGTIGLAATQVNLFVTTLLATSEGVGAVSWLQYAYRIVYLPLGLFGVSIATAVLPEVSRHAALQDRAAVRRTVSHGLALMLTVNLPATFGLIALSHDIVGLLLERGRFTAQDTAATAAALSLYAVGLVGYSTTRIASPVFYALGRNRIPVALSAISVAVNLLCSLLLVDIIGFSGLALATSLAALVNASICVLLLRRQLGGLDGARLASTALKVAAGSAAMWLTVVTVNGWLYQIASHGSTLTRAATLMVSIGAGLIVLTAAAKLLRIEPFEEIAAQARGRVRKLLIG
ncbi:MAG: murein biosynthesis integral membrane protein MurJ [Vicinamibacterales bacterium]